MRSDLDLPPPGVELRHRADHLLLRLSGGVGLEVEVAECAASCNGHLLAVPPRAGVQTTTSTSTSTTKTATAFGHGWYKVSHSEGEHRAAGALPQRHARVLVLHLRVKTILLIMNQPGQHNHPRAPTPSQPYICLTMAVSF